MLKQKQTSNRCAGVKPMQKPKTSRWGEKQKRRKSGNCPDPEESALLNHPCHSATLPLSHSATLLLCYHGPNRHACPGHTSLQSSWNISFKPNGLVSLFEQRIRRLLITLKTFIRAFYLAQWLNLLLAALFLKIFFLATKMSSLALSLPRAITPLPYHVPSLLLLLLLRQLFLLYPPWPNT